jgi:hypothetical protein
LNVVFLFNLLFHSYKFVHAANPSKGVTAKSAGCKFFL